MEWTSAVEGLPLWKEVQVERPAVAAGDALLSKDEPSVGLRDLFAVVSRPSAKAAARDASVYAVLSQRWLPGSECSQVAVRVALLSSSGPGIAPKQELRTLAVDVPGYNVEASGHFSRIIVGGSGRGLLLLAPRCCAAAAAPDADECRAATEDEMLQVRAVTLPLPDGVSFVKALWHPLSDAHAGVLLSNGTFELLNLAQRSCRAELRLQVNFGSLFDGESAVDFAFCSQSGPSAPIESAWLAMTVLFASSRGKMSFFSPVLPSVAVFPTPVVDALASACGGFGDQAGPAGLAAREWLSHTVLAPGARQDLKGSASGLTTVKHDLHLNGHSQAFVQLWTPSEQVLGEDRPEGAEASPRSPRHQRSSYCSAHLVCHSPTAVMARATATGLVEFLVASRSLGPGFQRTGVGAKASKATPVTCAIFEEVDLAPAQAKQPVVRLSALDSAEGVPLVLAQTRNLLAVIALPWCATLISGGAGPAEALQAAVVTTLAEARAADGPCEFLGQQPLRAAAAQGKLAPGILLRLQGDAAAAGVTAQAIDVPGLVTAALAKARSGKPAAQAPPAWGAASSADSGDEAGQPADREEYLRHLTAPVLFSKPIFGAASKPGPPCQAVAVVEAVAAVQGGQLADLAARKVVLKHLLTQLPGRASDVRAEVTELRKSGEKLRQDASDSERAAKRILERQKDLEAQHARLVTALAAKLEMRELEGLNADELPKLWSQLYDLRQAFELLRAASVPAQAGSAPGQAPQQASKLRPEDLMSIESLQRTWTDASAVRLRSQADEADALVAKLTSQAPAAAAA